MPPVLFHVTLEELRAALLARTFDFVVLTYPPSGSPESFRYCISIQISSLFRLEALSVMISTVAVLLPPLLSFQVTNCANSMGMCHVAFALLTHFHEIGVVPSLAPPEWTIDVSCCTVPYPWTL